MQKATVTKVESTQAYSSPSSAFQIFSIFFDCYIGFIFSLFFFARYFHPPPSLPIILFIFFFIESMHKLECGYYFQYQHTTILHFASLSKDKSLVSSFSSNNNIWMCFHNENIWNKWVYDTTSISMWKQDESTMALTNEKIRLNEKIWVSKWKRECFIK